MTSSEKLNTHYYDNKLSETYFNVIKGDNNKNGNLEMIDMYHEFTQFIKNNDFNITTATKESAIKSLNIIKQNKNKINGINGEELLARIWRNIDKTVSHVEYSYIIEQLSDISSKGSCLQGICHRLLQILKSIIPLF